MPLTLAVGDPLPSIGLRATDGYLLNLRSFATRQPVAYLFFGGPSLSDAAARPGMAAVQALAAGRDRLHQAGIAVVGVSCDSEQQQLDFVARHEIPFLLFSDERRSAVDVLGVPTVSQRENVNVARPLVLAVDREGTVRAIIERVEPDYLVEQIIGALSEPMTAPAEDAAAAS